MFSTVRGSPWERPPGTVVSKRAGDSHWPIHDRPAVYAYQGGRGDSVDSIIYISFS